MTVNRNVTDFIRFIFSNHTKYVIYEDSNYINIAKHWFVPFYTSLAKELDSFISTFLQNWFHETKSSSRKQTRMMKKESWFIATWKILQFNIRLQISCDIDKKSTKNANKLVIFFKPISHMSIE